MFLSPLSVLPESNNNRANGVGAAPHHPEGAKKKAHQSTGKRDPKAVDMETITETNTRVDNISDNIFVNLQYMMDSFHNFDLSTVFFHYSDS